METVSCYWDAFICGVLINMYISTHSIFDNKVLFEHWILNWTFSVSVTQFTKPPWKALYLPDKTEMVIGYQSCTIRLSSSNLFLVLSIVAQSTPLQGTGGCHSWNQAASLLKYIWEPEFIDEILKKEKIHAYIALAVLGITSTSMKQAFTINFPPEKKSELFLRNSSGRFELGPIPGEYQPQEVLFLSSSGAPDLLGYKLLPGMFRQLTWAGS